jgi:hypothetical protein
LSSSSNGEAAQGMSINLDVPSAISQGKFAALPNQDLEGPTDGGIEL